MGEEELLQVANTVSKLLPNTFINPDAVDNLATYFGVSVGEELFLKHGPTGIRRNLSGG